MQFPGPEDRSTILGRTGSGKTTAAAFLLSLKNFKDQPWVMINTKGDKLLNEIASIDGVKTLSLQQTPGAEGLYMVTPKPSDKEATNLFLERIWEKQNCGVYVDEGLSLGFSHAFETLLTQGRARRIPMIVISQRPAWLSKFVFSEADFVQVFKLQHEDDLKTVSKFVPLQEYMDARKRLILPDYESLWYEVAGDEITPLSPVPDKVKIVRSFKAQLGADDINETSSEKPAETATVNKRRVNLI
jgi:hypothetical protein